jgi:transposase
MNEKRLAMLIQRRDRLTRELREVEPRLRAAINQFGKEQGYLIPLRIEQVRPMVGLDVHGTVH